MTNRLQHQPLALPYQASEPEMWTTRWTPRTSPRIDITSSAQTGSMVGISSTPGVLKTFSGSPRKKAVPMIVTEPTGIAVLHELEEDPRDIRRRGRIIVLGTNREEIARIILPQEFELRSPVPAEWQPSLFKEYLSEVLGFRVCEVYYKVRDKNSFRRTTVRFATLGLDDKSTEWPFVPGMKVYVSSQKGRARGRREDKVQAVISEGSTRPSAASIPGFYDRFKRIPANCALM
mmetsp:Transcript_45800/g.88115  ORF Transcript_45800/g.88115 Transcript_45800/m.88115 type:complete len:233 (-) Transcript_45800:71-769(-)